MRKNSLLLLTLFFFGSFPVMAAGQVIQDDSGHIFRLKGPVQRVISLAPHITELVFVAGGGSKLVGTVEYSRFPEQARTIPRIGNSQSLDLEQILKLRPDIVLAWQGGNAETGLQQLRKLGINVFSTDVKTLNDIPRLIRVFSRLTGSSQGEIAADRFRRRLDTLTQKHINKSPVSVFYQIWNRPLMTLNRGHYISDVISRCGGRNIITDTTLVAPVIDREYVIVKNPQVIISAGSPSWLAEWKHWKQIDAVRFEQLYRLNPDDIARPVPAILNGMEQICTFLDKARKASYRSRP